MLAWGFAALPLLGWWLTGLFDMDEGFYGAVVAEMNRRGEWITPYYNGHPWFEKPILLYWIAKPLVAVLGTQVGARLASVLATLGTYGFIAWFARRRWGDAAAQWCLLVTASSLIVAAIGRLMMTDPILCLCLTGAFLTFWESLVGSWKWRLAAAGFLGLSVLAKGPVGLMLFAPIAGWTYWREPQLRPAFKGGWLLGTTIFLAVVASWYLPAYLANGDQFVQKFLVEQNLQRFTGGDQAHSLPLLAGLPFYPVVLLVLMAPWSFYLLKAWPRRTDEADGADLRFLAAWALIPLIFFTLSKAKLPHYVLPCAPPLAMLAARYLWTKRARMAFPMAMCALAAILLNLAFIAYFRWSGHAELDALAATVRSESKPGEDVAAYQMPRRQRDMGTGRLRLQETSHPSLAMLLDRTIQEPDTVQDLLADPAPQWVLTRANRIGAGDLAAIHAAGREITTVPTDEPQMDYRLFHLSAQASARTRRSRPPHP